MDNIKWFKNAKYGLMVHFGLYSLLEGSYKGKKSKSYAEWIQSSLEIPVSETERLASIFNPIYFDAEEWVLFAKECGMEYIVITSKHHEGFALFKSEADSFNCYDSSPFKRDIIGELAGACKKHGLKLGLYYSQDLDWHEENGGGYKSEPVGCAGVSWDNSWDFPNKDKKDFNITFNNKILPQIKEIMTKYGDICLVWFDMPMTLTAEQSEQIYQTVKKCQPNCLVNSRLGNGKYDYVSLGDNEIPDTVSIIDGANVDYNDIEGFKPSPYGLYESACTLNDSWGYTSLDNNWKSAEQIYENKKKLNSLGINYLINIGPDHLGRFPLQATNILREVKRLEEQEYEAK
ncbi:MAG: alpha-L-fucosidase [Clostridia bacterium]|nr:alpha-L-fucosidase [Clostridia bacterium]